MLVGYTIPTLIDLRKNLIGDGGLHLLNVAIAAGRVEVSDLVGYTKLVAVRVGDGDNLLTAVVFCDVSCFEKWRVFRARISVGIFRHRLVFLFDRSIQGGGGL